MGIETIVAVAMAAGTLATGTAAVVNSFKKPKTPTGASGMGTKVDGPGNMDPAKRNSRLALLSTGSSGLSDPAKVGRQKLLGN